MRPGDVAREIKSLTAEMISSGLAIDQNFPSIRRVGSCEIIGFAGQDELSVTLRNVPYIDAYADLRRARSFNALLIDGGLIQFLYYFEGNNLLKHRLAFFPSPDLLEYQNNPEVYEMDEMYGDVIHKGVVTSPIRFDFDPDAHIDVEHPISHLTIGQYKNCRIPVTGPLSPSSFCTFILRSFYNTPSQQFLQHVPVTRGGFSRTITAGESALIHLSAHP